jgi:hypothetical protein
MIFEVTLPNGSKMYTNLIITHRGSKPIEFRVVSLKGVKPKTQK